MLAILGPTAAGKTALAIAIAQRLGAEIISVDSMQVYRGMDVGTAKPTLIERRGVAHHMIDVVEPTDEFSVAEFRLLGRRIMEEAEGPLIVTGGSGLHFRALVDPLSFAPTDPEARRSLESLDLDALVDRLIEADPAAANFVDLSNRRRVVRAVEILQLTGETPSSRGATAEAHKVRRYEAEIDFRAVGLDPGADLDSRIGSRLQDMRAGGLKEEVSRLRGKLGRTAAGAVGYKEMLSHLSGEIGEEEAFTRIHRNTRRLARRQRTWFQRDPRIKWIPWIDDAGARARRVMEWLT